LDLFLSRLLSLPNQQEIHPFDPLTEFPIWSDVDSMLEKVKKKQTDQVDTLADAWDGMAGGIQTKRKMMGTSQ